MVLHLVGVVQQSNLFSLLLVGLVRSSLITLTGEFSTCSTANGYYWA